MLSINRLNDILKEKENWDSYGAAAIRPINAVRALSLIRKFSGIGINNLNCGGIMLDLISQEFSISVEIK